MTPAELLASFENFADAPEGIKRLRELVLGLAVRGKLVFQEAGDASAQNLLDKVAAEKRRLVSLGQLRQKEPVPRYYSEQLGYKLPVGWVATCAMGLGIINPRNAGDDSSTVAFAPMTVIPIDYRDPLKPQIRKWRDIKKGYTHFADGDIAVAKITPCFQNGKSCVMEKLPGGIGAGTTELNILRPLANAVEPRYLLIFFKSPGFISGGVATMSGTAGQQRVSTGYFTLSPIPLPPIREQRRIVAKVDELMALIDKLEAARNERESSRVAFRDSALAALGEAENAGEVRVAWKRVSEHGQKLLAEPADAVALRKIIIQLAVYGRLATQSPADEKASTLLRQIAEHRGENAIKIISGKPLSARAIPQNVQSLLPPGWSYCHIKDAFDVRDGTHDTPMYVADGVPLVTSKNLSSGKLLLDNVKHISQVDHAEICRRSRVDTGDILFAMIGSIGNPVIVPPSREFSIKNVALFKPVHPKLANMEFLRLFLEFAANQMRDQASGGVQKFVSLGYLRDFLLPLPPLAEQNRIVTKVDELMAQCDELEARLSAQATAQQAFAAAAAHHLAV